MLEIKDKITGKTFQISENDFENVINWEQAKCEFIHLGNGWRLPEIYELKLMFEELHLNSKGDFKNDKYWSNTENYFNNKVGFVDFNTRDNLDDKSNINFNNKENKYNIRAVRDVNLEIKCPLTGKKLQVAENDFEYTMDWEQAIRAFHNLGNGWRLPNLSELELIHKELHKIDKGNFKMEYYWSNNEFNKYYANLFDFNDGKVYRTPKSEKLYLRAVRDIIMEIKCPTTGIRLDVAEYDFENKMDWEQVIFSLNYLGNSWRLPNIFELELMDKELHQIDKGNFKMEKYWSYCNGDDESALLYNFKNGSCEKNNSKSNKNNVRIVRDFIFEFKKTINGNIIQVAINDLEIDMNWEQAKIFCDNLGNDWRLPEIDELKIMYNELHLRGKGNFKNARYWSRKESDKNHAWIFCFENGDFEFDCNKHYSKNYVRLVKNKI